MNSLVGVGYLISKSGVFFSIIKFIGAGYLIYLGYKSLIDRPCGVKSYGAANDKDMTKLEAIKMGFLTNATNPNAIVFFLSIFTLVVSRSTPMFLKSLYGMEMALAEFSWFTVLGTIISHKFIKQKIGRFQLFAERLMGVILILLGVKIGLF